MDEFELLIFILCGVLAFWFIRGWYDPLVNAWPPHRGWARRALLALLPVAAFCINLYALRHLAAADVVGIYVPFYLVMGYGWLYLCMKMPAYLFDLSWQEDAVFLNNHAALYPVAASFLGLTLIYAGANVGDGPGWWCVLVAGGLGLAAWLVLGMVLGRWGRVFERITVDRNLACGIRTGGYLLAIAIVLARACGGDWTSLIATVAEFGDGWPVLPLTAMALVTERVHMARERDLDSPDASPWGAALLALAMIALAVAFVVFLPPLPKNPAYGMGGAA